MRHRSQRPSVSYLPFYGGAAGQYLALTTDHEGAVLDQRIVSADSLGDPPQAAGPADSMRAVLRSLRDLAAEALALHSRGGAAPAPALPEEWASRLRALAEAAAELLRLVRQAGDDTATLLPAPARYSEEDVGEEGEGVDAPLSAAAIGELLSGTLVADAKPVGVAVVGESGLAAARPSATAVAAHGVALARPVAVAVAGIDPAALGITLQLNQQRH